MGCVPAARGIGPAIDTGSAYAAHGTRKAAFATSERYIPRAMQCKPDERAAALAREAGRQTELSVSTLRRIIAFLHRDETGSAAMPFIMALPIFLWIVAIIVQMALIVNAKIMVSYAADCAARSAVTSLPDGHPENIKQAACAALAPLSPKASSTDAEASAYADALAQLNVTVPASFAPRYSFAKEATDVSWSPEPDFAQHEGQQVDVTVTYRFMLTVPGALRLVKGDDTTIAGVKGKFWKVSATSRVQTAHGRKAAAQDNGWPQ